MMDKDKVLPLAIGGHPGQYPFRPPFQAGKEAQRDADMVILQRDYVPRERVKPLVEVLQILAEQGNYKGDMYSIPVKVWAVAQAALSQIAEENL